MTDLITTLLPAREIVSLVPVADFSNLVFLANHVGFRLANAIARLEALTIEIQQSKQWGALAQVRCKAAVNGWTENLFACLDLLRVVHIKLDLSTGMSDLHPTLEELQVPDWSHIKL